jgi:hypothetical protein
MQSYTYMRLRRWSLALTSAGGLPMSFVRGNKVFLQWWEHWLTRIHSAPLPGGSLPPNDAGTSDGKPLDDNNKKSLKSRPLAECRARRSSGIA